MNEVRALLGGCLHTKTCKGVCMRVQHQTCMFGCMNGLCRPLVLRVLHHVACFGAVPRC